MRACVYTDGIRIPKIYCNLLQFSVFSDMPIVCVCRIHIRVIRIIRLAYCACVWNGSSTKVYRQSFVETSTVKMVHGNTYLHTLF